jgi:hypothetical protein
VGALRSGDADTDASELANEASFARRTPTVTALSPAMRHVKNIFLEP